MEVRDEIRLKHIPGGCGNKGFDNSKAEVVGISEKRKLITIKMLEGPAGTVGNTYNLLYPRSKDWILEPIEWDE